MCVCVKSCPRVLFPTLTCPLSNTHNFASCVLVSRDLCYNLLDHFNNLHIDIVDILKKDRANGEGRATKGSRKC